MGIFFRVFFVAGVYLYFFTQRPDVGVAFMLTGIAISYLYVREYTKDLYTFLKQDKRYETVYIKRWPLRVSAEYKNRFFTVMFTPLTHFIWVDTEEFTEKPKDRTQFVNARSMRKHIDELLDDLYAQLEETKEKP